MALEINVDDIRQMYIGTLVMHKNKPVFVEDVLRDGTMQVFDLCSQRNAEIPFSMKDFTPPNRRIGFVNTRGSVVYVYRLPVRKYKIGIALENTCVAPLDVFYPKDRTKTVNRIKEFSAPEIADAMFNKYPRFEQAVTSVRKKDGAIAFDKQFAVTTDGTIYFKTKDVGTIARGCTKLEEIQWYNGCEHLIHLIGDNYAKNLPTSRKG